MLRLAIDVNTGNLVAWQGCAAVLPVFRQGTLPVQIRLVEADPAAATTGYAWRAADLSDYPQLRLGLWKKTSFAGADGLQNLALADSSAVDPVLTYNETDPDDPYFEGDWNLATESIADLSGKTLEVYFTLGLVYPAGTIFPLIDHTGGLPNALLVSATDDGFAASPGVTTSAGAIITLPVTLKSADGLRLWQIVEVDGNTRLDFVRLN